MRVVTAPQINGILTFRDLVETLRSAFRSDIETPVRHHHTIERTNGSDAALLLMPAWNDFTKQAHSDRGYIGVKVVSVFPDNAEVGSPTVQGVYLLLSGRNGETLAVMDGQALTLWRTAAASGLAASYLAREDASKLMLVGAGALAPYLMRAHSSVRPIRDVLVWNRSRERAERLARSMNGLDGLTVRATSDLEGGVRGADVISCATLSRTPLVMGDWLSPGAHLDLVGAFTPAMRESDDAVMRKARIFVDTRAGALEEGGDLTQPLADGVITEADVTADLFELCRGEKAGRRFYDQITVFKSVGTAIEDLAAAILVFLKT
ncbi:ornithine cyclodeaminase family protein [Breoghania sp. L-A4]|uniref:ornithine cyclodeaminase family protein n=1 Tax=Breoghania sp. L-A4 TaxID=2304600 RepID=UPI000E35EBB3|nr:ornithine cyclodeaminase family protein [Breoghania sp. L-A4]AXS39069.1 ornithine cyclodeaminase family protein [Breoghania sp. L-A4]